MPARRALRMGPLAAALALGATLTLAGCGGDESGGLDNVTDQIDKKTDEGADKVKDAGKDAADKAKDVGEDAGEEAENLGDHAEHQTDQ